MSQFDTARPAAPTDSPVRRIDSLTSLRFFAAAFVLVCHVQTSETFPSVFTEHLFAFPKTGVTFFFVLSGFVLAWSYRPDHPARSFYVRRFARIWPVHALVTVLLFGIGRMLAPDDWSTGEYLVVWVSVLLLVQSLCPLPSVHESVNPPAWTLSCEAFFYALFPLLRRRTAGLSAPALRRLIAAMLVLCLGIWIFVDDAAWIFFYSDGTQQTLRYLPALVHLPEFVIGLALAGLLRHRPAFPVTPAVATAAAAGLLLILGVLHWAEPAWLPLSEDAVAQYTSIPLSLIVVGAFAAHELNGRPSALQHRWLIRLGDWSYALYLTHLTVIHVASLAIGGRSFGAANVVAVPLFLLVSIALAGLLHYAVERPGKRFVIRRLLRDEQNDAGRDKQNDAGGGDGGTGTGTPAPRPGSDDAAVRRSGS
jgi:peptidoglycan/LPS O-acetylase OafA/YrhL